MNLSSQPTERSDLGTTVLKGIVESDHTKELAVELGEIALDQLLDDGLWRDLPLIGTVVGIVKTGSHVCDALFVRKVAKFVFSCPTFSDDDRAVFVREYLADSDKTKKLGDTLVLILDRLDDLEKPEMLARAFAALVRRRINLETFRRLATAIDIGFADDLRGLMGASAQSREAATALYSNLLRSGLTESGGNVSNEMNDGGINFFPPFYRLSMLGRVFIGCINETYDFATPKTG